jgi:photosystem II stability/assembly factor-like uncharacterized protein
MKKFITLFSATLISTGIFAQWDTLHSNTTTNFNAIAFLDENNGIAVGTDPVTNGGNAFETTDGGITWTWVTQTTHAYNDVFFSSQNMGWIAADSGYVVRETSANWMPGIRAHIGTKNFYTIFFPTDSIGYVGGESGVLYRTADSGLTWDTLNTGTNLSINDIYFSDPANGWIVGDGGYMATTADSGNTWTIISNPNFGFFNCNSFAYMGSTAEAYAVGNNGQMLHSTNGGLNWNAFSSGTIYTLHSVRFTNDLAGIVAGYDGTIHRTEDGGITWWNESMPYVHENLTGISWASDTLAYICGWNGRILKSRRDISAVHTVLPKGIELSAYPNPFADDLNIAIDLSQNSDVELSVMDVTGRIVLVENEGELNSGKHVLHPAGISSLVNGMYFVKVISDNGELTVPVVKE